MEQLRATSAGDPTRRAFDARARRWLPRVEGPLAALYGPEGASALTTRLLGIAEDAAAARKPDLRDLDAARTADPGWFQATDRIGYVAYAELFGPTLGDVEARIGYLDELGVTYLHLMKVLESRPAPNDGGFAVSDYRAVDGGLGSLGDLERLACGVVHHEVDAQGHAPTSEPVREPLEVAQ